MSLIEWMQAYGYGARAYLAKKLDIQPVTIDRWMKRRDLEIFVDIGSELGQVELVRVTKIKHLKAVQY